MAEYDGLTPGQILADASVAEFIKSLGLGIAEAQRALDENSVQQIAEFIEPREGLGGKTLLDLGLSPAFYHYQHADITCSLQLSLRVQKDLSLGLNLNGSFSDNSSNSSDSSESESSSESGSSTTTETRQANVEINSASTGALVVGGQNFALSGASPAERIRNLQNALTTTDGSGIDRVLYQLQGSELTISTDAEPTEVQTTPRTVAFLGGGHDSGIIRVGENQATVYTLDDSPATSANTTAQGDLAAYAAHVATAVAAQGYTTHHVAPGQPILQLGFDTGRHDIRPTYYNSLRHVAQTIRTLNIPVELEGFADRQMYSTNSDALNVQLGNNRANEVKTVLLANGAPANLITVRPSRGDRAAADAGNTRGQDNQSFRKVDITTPGRTHHWVFVHSQNGGPNLSGITPDMRGNTTDTNGFIFLFNPSPLDLTGHSVTIEGINFPFDGTAVGSFSANSPEAYAKNLADDINGNISANLQASANANVVTVSRNGDRFQLTLVTNTSREISLSGTSGVTVTTQFSRSRSSSLTRQNTGNRAVAVGASLDVRYSRQFEMNVTGNSSISARLVSIPAPPQFLETIREFLNSGDNN